MSLFNTLGTGASGLGATSSALSVIGDNIANVGTTGFKASRMTFADMFPEAVGTRNGVAKIGRGTMTGSVDTMFEQGALSQSGSVLDLAISGGGFYQVTSDGEAFYTRDGNFHLDKDGNVLNSAGMQLRGYNAQNGALITSPADMQIALGPVPAQATTAITLDANLAADADWTTIDYGPLVKDGNTETIADLGNAADFSTSVTVYDSLGVAHDVNLFFERTGQSDWTWSAVVDGGDVDTDGDGVPDGTSGYGLEISSGTLTFDGTGTLTSFTETPAAAAWNWPGANPFTFTLEAGLDAAGAAIDGGLTFGDGSSFTNSIQQDGYTIGSLVDLRIDADGSITGIYDNGQDQLLGQVALATFSAEEGLERIGGNMFRATPLSGEPAMGGPGEGGRGDVVSYALERSSVQLEEELIAMIQTQRAYQANAGVVRTTDEALQELVNLV